MASDLTPITFDDIRGGRNGVDAPLAIPEHQCAEAINVDFYDARVGRRRKGAIAYTPAPVGFGGSLLTLIRHSRFGKETNHELWGIDTLLTVKRLAKNVWSSPGSLTDAIAGATDAGRIQWASFNDKLFLAYGSGASNNLDRLHVFDPVTGTIRKAGLAAMTVPTWVPASGTAFTERRFYRTAATQKIGGVIVRRSDVSPTLTAPMVSGGGWVVTRGTPPGEGETHWELYAAKGNTPTGPTQIGAWYVIADLPLATTTFTDQVQYANFPPPDALLAPQAGANAPLPSAKYLLVDEARLLLAGWWPTAPANTNSYESRVWWTPILYDASQVANDEHLNLFLNPYIDFDPGEGGEITGLGGPLFDCPYVFKYNRIYKMVRTGLADAPYRPVTVSKSCGCIHQRTIVRAEDENGAECLYFLSKRGPYRIGAQGLQYVGRDIEDLWKIVNLGAIDGGPYQGPTGYYCSAHAVYHQDIHQIWWYVPVNGSTPAGVPTLKLVFDVRLGQITDVEGVRGGWVQHLGASCEAYASALFSQAWDPTNLTYLPSLKPVVSQSGADHSPNTREAVLLHIPHDPLPVPVPTTLGDPRIWQCDAEGVYTDLTDNYGCRIVSRAIALGGTLSTHGGVIGGHLVGVAFNATARLALYTCRDFYAELRQTEVLLLPPSGAGIPVRTILNVRDLGAVSAAAMQIILIDLAIDPTSSWQLDQLILRIRREEDR